MSDDNKRSVNDILSGIMKSLTSIGKDSVDLAKVGGEKVQEMIKEQQASKTAANTDSKPEVKEEVADGAEAEVAEDVKEEVADDAKAEVAEDVKEEVADDAEAEVANDTEAEVANDAEAEEVEAVSEDTNQEEKS